MPTYSLPRPERRSPTPLILYVGSLIERKNPSLVVRAMPSIRRTFPEATLLLKGAGEQEAMLRRLIGEEGLEHAVAMDTERSDHAGMADLYSTAWVAAFPTFRDLSTLAPVEAAGCGVPVVMSKRLPHARYLEETDCGIATSDDPEEFGGAVVRLLTRHGARGLSPEAVRPVVERFSIADAAERLLAYLESDSGPATRKEGG